jgi:taurine--2-oxoglutarate transaminase
MDRPYYITWTAQQTASTMEVASAVGATLVLADGQRVLDMISTSFQVAFGYSNAPIRDAIQKQLVELPVASPKVVAPWKDRVSHALLSYLKLPDGTLFYTVSGAEAVENALKMARIVTGRKLVLARRKSYHGASMGALSVTGDWRSETPVHAGAATLRIPEPEEDPDLEETRAIIERAGPGQIAAACLETITAMNGVIIPPRSWWQKLSQLLKEYDILLIVDEVSTGFGRTGDAFAFHDYGLAPDFVCMAKIITGGYIPFGALWTHPRVAAHFQEKILPCGLTSYAHPLGLAAMGAVVDQLTSPDFLQVKGRLEACLSEQLELARKWTQVREIRHKGTLAAIDLQDNLRLTWAAGMAEGLHLAVKDTMIVLAPPYVMTPEQLKDGFTRLRRALATASPSC